MIDVVGVGEVLIDFSPGFPGPMGNPGFEMNPGGAPANCLAANAKLGGKCAFIGTVGNDFFGGFLKKSLDHLGICTDGMIIDEKVPTTIDFVSNREDGERDFAFFRNPGADMMLQIEKIKEEWWEDAAILHFGTLGLTDEPSRSSTYRLLEQAKARKLMISFDPNYRDSLWSCKEEAVVQMKIGMTFADILKVSVEEMRMILEDENISEKLGAEKLFKMGISYVLVTAGERGAWFHTVQGKGYESGFPVHAIDTTGCGDAFLGAIHYLLLNQPDMTMKEKVRFANATAALCALGRTGIPSMPDQKKVQEFIKEHE